MPTLLAANIGLLACPVCGGGLNLTPATVDCLRCHRRYPIVDALPVLIPARALSSEQLPPDAQNSASN